MLCRPIRRRDHDVQGQKFATSLLGRLPPRGFNIVSELLQTGGVNVYKITPIQCLKANIELVAKMR